MDSDIMNTLSTHQLRITQPRQLVIEALSRATAPLSTAEIIQVCSSVDRVSVYRTLELFRSLGIVTTISHGWKHAYELADPYRPHHHHVRCEVCGRVIDIESDQLEALIDSVAKKHGITVSRHTFEIVGRCKTCRL